MADTETARQRIPEQSAVRTGLDVLEIINVDKQDSQEYIVVAFSTALYFFLNFWRRFSDRCFFTGWDAI